MEDYKKKYEEALERAKGMYEQGMMPERIEYIFPELKESEDERIRKELLYYIQQEKNYIESKVKPENSPKLRFLIDAITWLEKQGEQKPAWSEEDERYYDSALWHIKNSCGIEGNIYNWLKSLRERYAWKPSNEQTDALNIFIGEANSYDTAAGYEEAEILSSLYEQLKKLKGE